MQNRRDFLRIAAGAMLLGSKVRAESSAKSSVAVASAQGGDRVFWQGQALRLAMPVLLSLSERQLKKRMPVEARHAAARAEFTHLEAFGRLLCGLAPWIALGPDGSAEGVERARLADLARRGLDAATDPASPDRMNFSGGTQPLVDAAFLAQALLRAPAQLWDPLEPRVRSNVVSSLKASRSIKPGENNWVLFAAEIEAFLQRIGEKRDNARLESALRKYAAWYVGDGVYGDGPRFHWDYYNSFVIQPMLLETLDVVAAESAEWGALHAKVRERLTRFAAIEERLIAPDGTYPVVGRSIAYRCGAFQVLALAALRRMLPESVSPGQARKALTSVIRRTLEPADTWDDNGWLRIGVSGHQPGLGEDYISTGSLYLCSAALLPLGLPAGDPFWSDPSGKTTWESVWGGADLAADHALRDA